MWFTFLLWLSLSPLVLAGDNWEDFTNNLATDLVSCCSAVSMIKIESDINTACYESRLP